MREIEEFQPAVIELCKWMNLYVYHTHDSRRSARGFPDLVIVGPGGILFRELKTETGRLSREQTEVLARLTTAGADAAVWRPADLTDGVISAELEHIRRAGG